MSEEEAADALATGIADRGGYSDVAVCIVEPDDALVTLVDAGGVTTEHVNPTADDMLALLDRSGGQPEAIFVLGSADDIDSVAVSFHGAAVPVITAAEADLALAREPRWRRRRRSTPWKHSPPGGACRRESVR